MKAGRLIAVLRRRPADWLLLGEAFAELVRARLDLRWRAFATIDRRLRRSLAAVRPAQADRDHAVAAVAWAIGAWSAHGPIRFLCFAQAIAAQAMLRRRGVAVAIHYGVCREPPGTIATHAWAMSGTRPVIGAQRAADFTLLHVFAADADPA